MWLKTCVSGSISIFTDQTSAPALTVDTFVSLLIFFFVSILTFHKIGMETPFGFPSRDTTQTEEAVNLFNEIKRRKRTFVHCHTVHRDEGSKPEPNARKRKGSQGTRFWQVTLRAGRKYTRLQNDKGFIHSIIFFSLLSHIFSIGYPIDRTIFNSFSGRRFYSYDFEVLPGNVPKT